MGIPEKEGNSAVQGQEGSGVMSKKVIREKGYATALRIVFAFIMAITVGMFTNSIVMHNTLYSEQFWKKTLMSEEIKEEIKTDMLSKIREYVVSKPNTISGNVNDISLQDVYDLETGNAFADEMIDYTMDEVLDMILNGDSEFDEERFDKIFDEYGEDFINELEESGLKFDREEFMASKSELFEQLNTTLSEAKTETDNAEVFDYLSVTRYQKNNFITMIVTGVITVILLTVLILIHKNRFRPVRAFGIGATIMEVISLIGWLIVWGIANLAGSAVDNNEKLAVAFVKAASGSILSIVGIFAIASAVTVLLLIGGCVGVGIMNNAYRKKNPEQAAPAAPVAYAQPQVQYPQQYAAVAGQPVAYTQPQVQYPQQPVTQYPPQPQPVTAYPPQPVPVTQYSQPVVQQQPAAYAQPQVQQPAAYAQPQVQQPAPVVQQPAPAAQPAPAVPQAAAASAASLSPVWNCPNCGKTGISTPFCNECGSKRP